MAARREQERARARSPRGAQVVGVRVAVGVEADLVELGELRVVAATSVA